MDSHGSEQPVIDAIDALIDESMAAGEDYGDNYDECPQCHHQWHGLACLYMSGGSNPCRCTSNVQSEQSTKASDDVGVRPRWIGGPAGNGGSHAIVTVRGGLHQMHSEPWREQHHIAITMPNGDIVRMSGENYHGVLERARQVIASIYEVMNTLTGMDLWSEPVTDEDVESILFADVPQRIVLGDNGLWIPTCDESHC